MASGYGDKGKVVVDGYGSWVKVVGDEYGNWAMRSVC